LRNFLQRRLYRYRQDLFGGFYEAIYRSRSRIDRLITVINAPPHPHSSMASDEINAPGENLNLDPVKHYQHQAWMARALLGGSAVSAMVLLHRLLLGDGGGALASLGSTATLLGLALHPAYRCWTMRHRPVAPPQVFLTHPLDWWPPAGSTMVASERSASHDPADR
jgi:hypothetical protein